MTREEFVDRARPLLASLYPGREVEVLDALVEMVDRARRHVADGPHLPTAPAAAARARGRSSPPDHGSAVLITYGDAIRARDGEPPLATLREVLERHVGDAITDVHILPMFPSSSDDGFAVVDHRAVDPALGTWADVEALGDRYRLMFDFVANHVSSRSAWFTGFLAGDPALADRFVRFDPEFDTSRVVRPRTSPLFHTFPAADGSDVRVWTTFSQDQCDVDVASPATLLDLTDVLLGYLARGAASIRLDAIGFLWKSSGTPCIHLPQTHAVVRLWRLVVDHVAPGTQIVTETNVPQAENISYFGDGTDEAHQVYQFALPPLVLHAFVTGSGSALSRWAATLAPVSPTATYFNFLASHDGIGMRPVEDILGPEDRAALVERVLGNGGMVSMKAEADGSESVYELNINYLDALATRDELAHPATVARKGLAAHAILLTLIGIPGIYYHSLFGSASDGPGAAATGIARRINRERLRADTLAHELATDERRRTVFEGLMHMLRVRSRHPAFSPYAPQDVEDLDPRVFAVRRTAGASELLCVVNLTDEPVRLPVTGRDVLTGRRHTGGTTLPGYGVAWLTALAD